MWQFKHWNQCDSLSTKINMTVKSTETNVTVKSTETNVTVKVQGFQVCKKITIEMIDKWVTSFRFNEIKNK